MSAISAFLSVDVSSLVDAIRRVQLGMEYFAAEVVGTMIANPRLWRAVRNGRRYDVQKRFETLSRKRRRKANRMADKRRGVGKYKPI